MGSFTDRCAVATLCFFIALATGMASASRDVVQVEKIYPSVTGSVGGATLRVFGSGPDFDRARITIGGRTCEHDAVLSGSLGLHGHFLACTLPPLPEGKHQVDVLIHGKAHSCKTCVVHSEDSHNVFALVEDELWGCAGDTIHLSSAHEKHWHGVAHANSQVKVTLGGLVSSIDEHSTRFRWPKNRSEEETDRMYERSNVHQLHLRIPGGLEAGVHKMEVVLHAQHHTAFAHGRVRLSHSHKYHGAPLVNGTTMLDSAEDEKEAYVKVIPAIHKATLDTWTGLTTIVGTGFSVDSTKNKVAIGGVECVVQESDFGSLVARCPKVSKAKTYADDKEENHPDIGLVLNVVRERDHHLSELKEQEPVFVRNELEWPVANPAVHIAGHFQTGVFVAESAMGTWFQAPFSAFYSFEMHCGHHVGTTHRVSPEDCYLAVGAQEENPKIEVYLEKGHRLPLRLRFKHITHGDHFRISLSARTSQRTVVYHTVPASWLRHIRPACEADSFHLVPSVVTNGVKALCRADDHSRDESDMHCRLHQVHLKKTNIAPARVAYNAIDFDTHTPKLRRSLLDCIPEGAMLFSEWRVQAGCVDASSACEIPAGTHVIFDVSADIGSMIIKGKLEWGDLFLDAPLTLATGFLVVEGDGEFFLDARVSRSTKQTLHIKNNGMAHQVLGVRSFGTFALRPTDRPVVRVQGFPLARTWTVLTANANSGASTITVEHDATAMGWFVGDRIALAPTARTFSNPYIGPEVFEIAAVNGRTITLGGGTTNQLYLGLEDKNMQAEVINLSRNVHITGDEFTNNQGLHTVAHSPGGFMQIRHTRVDRCGRRGELGKYCLHFHLKRSCPDCIFQGNAIEDGQQRGVVVHGTHESWVEDNVMFKVLGAGYYVEDGNEMDNTFVRNVNLCHATAANRLACQAKGTDNDNADDIQQSGMWVLSVSNNFIENHMVNHNHAFFTQVSFRSFGRGAAEGQVCTVHAPFGTFIGNVNHNQHRFNFYADNNFPRQVKRSISTNGLVADIGCGTNPQPGVACSCAPFKADGTDNGKVGYVQDGVDWNALFMGQYELGDISYVRHYSVHNNHNMYWKTTKNFADGFTSHIKDGFFGAHSDVPGYSDYAAAHVAGPGGLGAFIVERTKFFGTGPALASNQHCMVGYTGAGCAPEYTLLGVDFSDMKLDGATRWILHGISDGDTDSPMYVALDDTSFGQDASGRIIRGVASGVQKHLLGLRDSVTNEPLCRRSTDPDVNMARALNDGIVCYSELRRLQVWTKRPLGTQSIRVGSGDSYNMRYICFLPDNMEEAVSSSSKNGNRWDGNNKFRIQGTFCRDTKKQGYSAALAVKEGQTLQYTLLEQVDLDDVTLEFSDPVYANRFNRGDSVSLVVGNGQVACTPNARHDRRWIGYEGPLVDGRGACKGNLDELVASSPQGWPDAIMPQVPQEPAGLDAPPSSCDGNPVATRAPVVQPTPVPSITSPPSDSAGGDPTCEEQLDNPASDAAGTFTCRARINWLQTVDGGSLTPEEASNFVANEFPSICGACGNVSTKVPTPQPTIRPTPQPVPNPPTLPTNVLCVGENGDPFWPGSPGYKEGRSNCCAGLQSCLGQWRPQSSEIFYLCKNSCSDGLCTRENNDPFQSGVEVECCDPTHIKCLHSWDNPDPTQRSFRCKTSRACGVATGRLPEDLGEEPSSSAVSVAVIGTVATLAVLSISASIVVLRRRRRASLDSKSVAVF